MIPSFPLEYVLIIGLGLIIIVLIAWCIRLEKKIENLSRGKNGASLEGVMNDFMTRVEKLESVAKSAQQDRQVLRKDLDDSVRGIATLRFNPYGDGTGKQSFATALVNSHGDGVIISSLFAREQSRVYAKPIKKLASEYELSAEEKKALDMAFSTYK